MIIAKPNDEDLRKIDELHDKFFSKDFIKTDFTEGFLQSFVIKDNDGKILIGGGIRPIAETIIVTDKDANPHKLGDALLEALRFSVFTCQKYNIGLLHAFVKDEQYTRHLIDWGFEKRCQALYKAV